MRPIKVNYIDNDGKRTSTTISPQISLFWGRYHGCMPLDDVGEYQKQISQAIQTYVNQLEHGLNKDIIESYLLSDVERKIIEKYEHNNRDHPRFCVTAI